MKILICGKGGSGKSTITTLLARSFLSKGYRVLVVDMDESNTGLHKMLGLNSPASVLDDLGGKAGLREKMNPAFPGSGNGGELFASPIKISELPERWVSGTDTLKLMAVGKIHTFGEGCACPMGGLARSFLSALRLEKMEIVLIDTAAGVEHFGRGIDRLADNIVGVVDPTFASLELAEKMKKLAGEAETGICFVFNKVDSAVESLMEESFSDGQVVARVPNEPTLPMDGLAGKPLDHPALIAAVEPICRLVS